MPTKAFNSGNAEEIKLLVVLKINNLENFIFFGMLKSSEMK